MHRTLLRALFMAVSIGGLAALSSCGGSKPPPPCEQTGTCPCGTPTGPVCPPPPAQSEVLVGAGDIALCGSAGAMATANQIQGISGRVFAAGDLAYFSGTPQEFRDCYDPTWGRPSIKSRTWPVPGNHEYQTPGASGYYSYFGDAAGPSGLGYYRRSIGAWTFLGINSEIDVGPTSAQYLFLRSELTTNPTSCTVAVWHKPLFTSGPNGDNRNMLDIFRLLYDNNVDVVINGHDHLYEVFAPQNPSGAADAARGIRQFTVGTGGATPYGFQAIKPTSERRINDVYGVLKLTLMANSYTWEFLQAGGGVQDSGSGMCH